MKKLGRNDPCHCGSGKKFKKCCEATMLGGRFQATRIDATASAPIQKTVNLSHLFQNQLALTPKKPLSERISTLGARKSSEEIIPSKEGIC
jgi:hypothetical protein